MYFINGKNNLESSALMDMNALEQVGSNGKVKIAVELGRMNGQYEGDDHAEGDWTGVRRYLVTKDADSARITSPILQDLGRADMGSWKELAAFIKWSKANFPARRYALVLWDHGNGWEPVSDSNSGDFYNLKGFSLDDETGHEFSLPQMAEALRLGEMKAFRARLDAWAAAAVQADPAALRAAAARAKFFGEYPAYKDLCDFVGLVTASTADPALKALGRDLVSFVKTRLVIENWAQDAVSHGVAIYVPSDYNPLYDGLSLSRDTRWDDFARRMSTLK